MFDTREDGLSYVIGAYNEQSVIEDSILRCVDALSKDFKNYEIIVVDDGSSDQTVEVVKKLQSVNSRIRLLTNGINMNFGISILRGMCAAKYDYITYNAADLPLQPEMTLKLLEKMQDSDVMVLDRDGYKPRIWRRLTSTVNRGLIKLFFPVASKGLNTFNYIQFFRADAFSRIKPLARSPIFAFAEMIFRARYLGLKVINIKVPVVLAARKGAFGKPNDIIWGIYDMLRFRIRRWSNNI